MSVYLTYPPPTPHLIIYPHHPPSTPHHPPTPPTIHTLSFTHTIHYITPHHPPTLPTHHTSSSTIHTPHLIIHLHYPPTLSTYTIHLHYPPTLSTHHSHTTHHPHTTPTLPIIHTHHGGGGVDIRLAVSKLRMGECKNRKGRCHFIDTCWLPQKAFV